MIRWVFHAPHSIQKRHHAMNTHRQPKNTAPLGLVSIICIPLLALVIAFAVYNARNPLPDPPAVEETGAVNLAPSDAGGAEPAPSDGGGSESGTGLIGDIPVPEAPASPESKEKKEDEKADEKADENEPAAENIGVDPAEVAIPDEVSKRLEGANVEAVPAQVVTLQSKGLPTEKDAATEPTDRTVEQTLAPIWDSLSPDMQKYATDQHDIWTSSDSTKAQKDAAYKNLFALTPVAPQDNTYILENNESVQVDAKGAWGAYLYNMEVIGTDVGLSGQEGMVISLDRWIDIPLTNDEFDITIGTNIIYTLIPNPDNEDEWLIDGVSWHSAPAEKVNK